MGADEQARTGWYIPAAYDVIREMIKVKYVYVRDNNEPAPDSICYDLMQAIEDTVVAGHTAEKGKDKNTAGEAGGEDEVSFVSDCVRKLTLRREMSICFSDTQNPPRPGNRDPEPVLYDASGQARKPVQEANDIVYMYMRVCLEMQESIQEKSGEQY